MAKRNELVMIDCEVLIPTHGLSVGQITQFESVEAADLIESGILKKHELPPSAKWLAKQAANKGK